MATLKEEHVLIHPTVTDRTTLLELMSSKLEKTGITYPGFIKAVLAREEQFPTGLPTENVRFAIPHADAKFVRNNALALAVLSEPIGFQRMDNPEQEIKVEVVVMMAIKDSEAQLKMLQKLIALFGDNQFWAELLTLTEPQEVVQKFNAGLRD